MDSLHNECCLFNCGLWPPGRHWPHKLTNLSGQCTLCLPHKVCVSSCCQSLPCAVWLDQTWVFFSPPCYLWHAVLMCKHPVWTVWATEMVSSSCFPSPFSVHVSAVKCIKCFLGEKHGEGTTEFWWQNRAALEPLWVWLCWSTWETSPAGPSLRPTPSHCSTSGSLSPPKHLLERCWGGEGGLIVNQNTQILKPNSAWQPQCSGSVQFDFVSYFLFWADPL